MTVEFVIDPIPTTLIGPNRKEAEIKSGDIWPIPIRGSKYNITFTSLYSDNSPENNEPRIVGDEENRDPTNLTRIVGGKWRIGMKRLDEFSPGPVVSSDTIELIENIRFYRGGPVVITPKGEALAWRLDPPGGKEDWEKYYLGMVNIDPVWHQAPYDSMKGGHPGVNGLFAKYESADCDWFTPEQWSLWTGCMFKTGEPWTVRMNAESELTWPGSLGKNLNKSLIARGTRPQHAELIKAYFDIRPCGGRLYVLMGGHIWINLRKFNIRDNEEMTADEIWDKISANMLKILKNLTPGEDHPLFKMFNARLMATKGTYDSSEACLPIYLGNVADFDDGMMPITKINSSYKKPLGSPDKMEGDEENPFADDKELRE